MFSNQILCFCRLVVINPALGDCAVLRRFRLARSQEGLFKLHTVPSNVQEIPCPEAQSTRNVGISIGLAI